MTDKNLRVEKDFIGEVNIPSEALYGINSFRAKLNFPDQTLFHKEWYCAVGTIKRACFLTALEFFEKVKERASLEKLKIKPVKVEILHSLVGASKELEKGSMYDNFITPAISGGAGTSINMNVNEILANRALQILGRKPGDYEIIDPIEHANIFQSTNDVIPTSLKVTVIKLLEELEEQINILRQIIEKLEKRHQNDIRKGYTQMQEAVPTSFGRLFSTYNEALSRDWWRISKCFERIKVVNLGGSAIGSGITVPRYFIMEVVRKLQELTQLPITKSENMYDATSNLDSFVEVHGILKALAVNFEKMVSDIRLLASDVHVLKELELANKQVGSSIMPGKVNPVIPEFVISCSHKVYANDSLIAGLCAQGCLELNAYVPAIGHALIDSIKLLIGSARTLTENLFNNLVLNTEAAADSLMRSPAITTALLPYIGYNKAAEIARLMKNTSKSIYNINEELNFIAKEKLITLLKPENLLKEGFTLKDILA